MSFEEIVETAKSHDPETLRKAIGESCIDIWKPGTPYFSAVSHHAQIGDFKTVAFLIGLGANIHFALYGLMLGENPDLNYAQQLLKMGANLTWMVKGAAETGNHTLVNELLELEKDSIPLNMIVESAAFYAVKSPENLEYVKNLLFNNPEDTDINYAIRGAARGKYPECIEIVNALLDLKKDDPKFSKAKLLIYAAEGAAQAGNVPYVQQLLTGSIDLVNYNDNYCNLVYWAALGGPIKKVNELITWLISLGVVFNEDKDIESVFSGFAQCGNRIYVENEKVKNHSHYPIDLSVLVEYAAKGGHTPYTKYLLSAVINLPEIFPAAISGALEGGYISASNPQSQIWYFSFFKEKKIQQLLKGMLALNSPVPITIDPDVVKQSMELSTYRQQGYPYSKFSVIKIDTHPQIFKVRFLLRWLSEGLNQAPKYPNFPLEIWIHILNFILPVELNISEAKDFGRALQEGENSFLWQKRNISKTPLSNFVDSLSSFWNTKVSRFVNPPPPAKQQKQNKEKKKIYAKYNSAVCSNC